MFIVMVVLGGCVADAEEPPIVTTTPNVDATMVDPSQDTEMDVCALASELPTDDICSLMCDPPAMAERMVSDGGEPGACYQLYCALPGDNHALVGVCLPP